MAQEPRGLRPRKRHGLRRYRERKRQSRHHCLPQGRMNDFDAKGGITKRSDDDIQSRLLEIFKHTGNSPAGLANRRALALNRPEESPADAQELLCLKITHTVCLSLLSPSACQSDLSLVGVCISHLSILLSVNAGIPSMQLRLESCLVWHKVRRDDIYQLKII